MEALIEAKLKDLNSTSRQRVVKMWECEDIKELSIQRLRENDSMCIADATMIASWILKIPKRNESCS